MSELIVEVICGIGVTVIVIAVAVFAAVMMLEDTRTFRAIDKKIARMIEGDEDE